MIRTDTMTITKLRQPVDSVAGRSAERVYKSLMLDLAWTATVDVGPMFSTGKASADWRIASKVQSRSARNDYLTRFDLAMNSGPS
jgi:hypothetical protein